MTRGIPKKRAKTERLREKRAQAALLAKQGAKLPLRPIPVGPRRSRLSASKRQAPGGGA